MLNNHFKTNIKMNKCQKDFNFLINEGTSKVSKTASKENSKSLHTQRQSKMNLQIVAKLVNILKAIVICIPRNLFASLQTRIICIIISSLQIYRVVKQLKDNTMYRLPRKVLYSRHRVIFFFSPFKDIHNFSKHCKTGMIRRAVKRTK